MPLTKMSWIIAFPIWLILWGIWRFRNFRQFAAILLLGIYVINMGYLFDGSFRQLKDYRFICGTLTGQEVTKGRAISVGNRFAGTWLGHIPVPLPAEFVQGIDTQKIDFEREIESYARGVWSDRGFKVVNSSFCSIFPVFVVEKSGQFPRANASKFKNPFFQVFVSLPASAYSGFSIFCR